MPTTAEGWPATFPAGGRHEVKIAQRKSTDTGDPAATHYLYDKNGRLTDVWLPAVADALNGGAMTRPHWQYAYDINGNQISQTDPKGNTTKFEYDELNRRTKRILPIGVSTTGDPNDFVEEFQFDDYGRQNLHVTFEKKVIEFQYDNTAATGGRLLHKRMFADLTTYNGGAGTPQQTVDYTYDDMGRVQTITDSVNGDWSYTYDEQGRQTSVTSPVGTVRYEYDPATGRLMRTYTGLEDVAHTSAASDGKAVTDTRYDYDDLGRLKTVTVYEREDTPLATGDREVTTYFYDAVGNLDAIEQATTSPATTFTTI